jgi:RNA-binding protein
MVLTGKQKRHLRGLGHHLSAVVQIGKDGLSPSLTVETDRSLESHELIKIKALESCPDDIKDIANSLARDTNSSLVQTVGRTALLYRRRKEKPTIELPKAG